MGDTYDPRQLLKHIYTYDWDDDGKQAAQLTAWIGEALDHGKTSPDYDSATRAFDALTANLTSTGDHGIFRDLMDASGDKSSGETNPALIGSLMDTIHNKDIFDSLSREQDTTGASPLDEAARTRLLMLLAGDPDTAARLSAATLAYINDETLSLDPGNSNALSDRLGRMSAITDAAIFNEGLERTEDNSSDPNKAAFSAGVSLLGNVIP